MSECEDLRQTTLVQHAPHIATILYCLPIYFLHNKVRKSELNVNLKHHSTKVILPHPASSSPRQIPFPPDLNRWLLRSQLLHSPKAVPVSMDRDAIQPPKQRLKNTSRRQRRLKQLLVRNQPLQAYSGIPCVRCTFTGKNGEQGGEAKRRLRVEVGIRTEWLGVDWGFK